MTKVVIDYKWSGLAGRDSAHYEIDWNGSEYTSGKRTIHSITQLMSVSWSARLTTHPLQCISHTDDYPMFTIKIVGKSTMTVTSTSNCQNHVPWNIEKDGILTAQFARSAWIQIRWAMEEIDPSKWRNARDGEGTGSVMLDELPGTEAASCANSIEHDTDVIHAIGDKVHVDKLRLWCNLDESGDCSTAHAGAQFRWMGIDASAELSCSDGKATAGGKLADARTFLESKPVRALVKLARNAPKMTTARGWRIEAGNGLPTLEVRPGTSVILATGIRPAYWKELGLPPKLLPDDHAATLDYAGKLVP